MSHMTHVLFKISFRVNSHLMENQAEGRLASQDIKQIQLSTLFNFGIIVRPQKKRTTWFMAFLRTTQNINKIFITRRGSNRLVLTEDEPSNQRFRYRTLLSEGGAFSTVLKNRQLDRVPKANIQEFFENHHLAILDYTRYGNESATKSGHSKRMKFALSSLLELVGFIWVFHPKSSKKREEKKVPPGITPPHQKKAKPPSKINHHHMAHFSCIESVALNSKPLAFQNLRTFWLKDFPSFSGPPPNTKKKTRSP